MLHQKLQQARKQKGLTQEELADCTGITIRTIQRIENGESVPRAFTLKTIAAVLDIPFENLQQEEMPALVAVQSSLSHEDTVYFLQMLCLSCFSYILVPWVHFLIPGWMLRKKQGLDISAIRFARKLIRGQVYWVVSFLLAMLLTLAWNLFRKRNGIELPAVSYLTTLFVMYGVNAGVIIVSLAGVKRKYAG
jgi:transcriptional regulator with XRE-family HTH domain